MIKVTDHAPKFKSNVALAADMLLGGIAIDIERLSKMQVPQKTGRLQSSGGLRRKGLAKFTVEYNTPYARFQEFGGDSKRRVKNYSTAGRKSRYLRDPAQQVIAKAMPKIKAILGRVQV